MRFYQDIMPKIYGIGASVVIMGAMFKLLNWPGGSLMLGIGLTTEALIFFLSSFEPQQPELDWSRVYPELLDDYEGESHGYAKPQRGARSGVAEKMDELFQQAQIDGQLIQRLGQGMHRLSDSVVNLSSIADLTVVTEKYITNMGRASEAFEEIHQAQASALHAVQNLSTFTQDTYSYQSQVQSITKTLGELNQAYQRELQETDLRSKTTYEVYMRIADSMDRMQTASDETEKFAGELAQLSKKLSSLNSIYGNMLSAFKD